MSKKLLPLVLFAALRRLAGAQTSGAPEKHIAVTVDAGKTRAPISPYLYGQFIEHIGDLVNRSVWAEMLDDRKFYYAITSNPPLRSAAARPASRPPAQPLAAHRPRRGGGDGPRPSLCGEHTPAHQARGPEPRGIQQAGLVLRKSKAYSGRVVLAGEPGAAVTSAWSGAGPGRTADHSHHRPAGHLRQVPLAVHRRRRYRRRTHRDRRDRHRILPCGSRFAHAGRQHPRLPPGYHRLC